MATDGGQQMRLQAYFKPLTDAEREEQASRLMEEARQQAIQAAAAKEKVRCARPAAPPALCLTHWRRVGALQREKAKRTTEALKQAMAVKRPRGRPKKLAAPVEASSGGASGSGSSSGSGASGPKKRETYTDWAVPHLWEHIEAAVRSDGHLGAEAVVAKLKRKCRELSTFDRLTGTTLAGWFPQRPGKRVRIQDLSSKMRQRVELAQEKAAGLTSTLGTLHGEGGRPCVLRQHPLVEERIVNTLEALRASGASLSVPAMHAVVHGIIKAEAPDLLPDFKVRVGRPGRLRQRHVRPRPPPPRPPPPASSPPGFPCLQVSFSWLSRFLRQKLNWVYRRATKAAQKEPQDWEEQKRLCNLRAALLCGNPSKPVPPALFINGDQTCCHLVPSNGRTYAVKGSKEVCCCRCALCMHGRVQAMLTLSPALCRCRCWVGRTSVQSPW